MFAKNQTIENGKLPSFDLLVIFKNLMSNLKTISRSLLIILPVLMISSYAIADLWEEMRKTPYLLYTDSNTEMKIMWQLYESENCILQWGFDTNYGLGNVEVEEIGNDHQFSYTISNLTPATKYYYKVTALSTTFENSFYTAPVENTSRVKFMIYGDTRMGHAIHDSIATRMIDMANTDPGYQTFAICNGDIINDGDLESDWDEEVYNQDYPNVRNLFGSIPFLAVRGNHESSGVLFRKYFQFPYEDATYWSFDYGPVHVAIIDQYVDYQPGSPQHIWLEEDLASSDKQWKIVNFHEPGWSAGGRHENNEDVQNYLQPLFEEYGVALVSSAHNHYYARAEVNHVQHITTAGGGANLMPANPSYPNVLTTVESHHFCTIEITGDTLELTAIRPDGVIIDQFVIGAPRPMVSMSVGGLPIQIPAYGGRFEFDLEIINASDSTFNYDLWTVIEMPSGILSNPMIGPLGFSIEPGMTINSNRSQSVPASAQPGIYYYRAYIGFHPDIIVSEDSFKFEKLESVGGILPDTSGGESWLFIENELSGFDSKDSMINLHQQVYPNPFNMETNISFEIPESGYVSLIVYDILGNMVQVLVYDYLSSGKHSAVFTADNLSSGVYFVRLTVGNLQQTKKLFFVK